jgi:hypothetical protein
MLPPLSVAASDEACPVPFRQCDSDAGDYVRCKGGCCCGRSRVWGWSIPIQTRAAPRVDQKVRRRIHRVARKWAPNGNRWGALQPPREGGSGSGNSITPHNITHTTYHTKTHHTTHHHTSSHQQLHAVAHHITRITRNTPHTNTKHAPTQNNKTTKGTWCVFTPSNAFSSEPTLLQTFKVARAQGPLQRSTLANSYRERSTHNPPP